MTKPSTDLRQVQPGEVIRSEDWNAAMREIVRLGAMLDRLKKRWMECCGSKQKPKKAVLLKPQVLARPEGAARLKVMPRPEGAARLKAIPRSEGTAKS